MGKQLLITHNNQLISGKELFITDENSIYRKAKKAFLTVDGVHKLVYALEEGVKWEKYNCVTQISTNEVYSEVSFTPQTTQRTLWFLYAYYSYEIQNNIGFVGGYHNGTYNANVYISTVEDVENTNLIGMYDIRNNQVWEIISVDKVATGGATPLTLTITEKLVAQCEITSTTETRIYLQGSTLYGIVEAPVGALPENGILFQGSPQDLYCILVIDSTFYYYVKQI